MPQVHRRVIPKPSQADPSTLAKLSEALGEAVGIQNRLAVKSPYVLRLTGSLEQDEVAYWVEHERAEPLVVRSLYEAGQPDLPPEQLAPIASALLSALAAGAEAGGSGRATVHGGVCPGVLLTGADGLVKVSDFGFAPALCRCLGVDAYLNLALGPQADSTGTWEVLGEEECERDDRLCGFVDPEKYGQDLLGSFEPGSDVIAAGMTLYLLMERRHPYLCFDPVAHRFVDTARMMSFGVPMPFARRDVLQATSPTIQACRDVVVAALERLPSRRPSAGEMSQRLAAAAPAPDLDRVSAQRWLAHLEGLLEAEAWQALDKALKEPPALRSWPSEVQARAEEVGRRAREQLAKLDSEAALEAEHQKAERWFAQLQQAAEAEEWQAAHELIQDRPRLKKWPESISAQIDEFTTLVNQKLAEEGARVWARTLSKAFQSRDWSAVGRCLARRPKIELCPPDVRELSAQVEGAYQEYSAKEKRRLQDVEEQRKQAREWLARARVGADAERWSDALDILKAPPELEHWPADVRDESRQLQKLCEAKHGERIRDHLNEIEKNLEKQGVAAIREVVAKQFGGLVHPDGVQTSVEVVWGSPSADAHGRAIVFAGLRPAHVKGTVKALRSELDFKLDDIRPQVVAGLDDLRRTVLADLPRQLLAVQVAQLRVLEESWHDSVFPQAAVHLELSDAQGQANAAVRLLGTAVVEGELAVELRWNDRELGWGLKNPADFVRCAAEVARAVTGRAILETLLSRSASLRPYQRFLAVVAEPVADAAATRLPTQMGFALQIVGDGKGGLAACTLETGKATSVQVGWARFEASLEEVEAEFAAQLAPLRNRSRDEVVRQVQDWATAQASPVQVVVPKRGKELESELRFELRWKDGSRGYLDAIWNPEAFAYELPAAWERSVQPSSSAASGAK